MVTLVLALVSLLLTASPAAAVGVWERWEETFLTGWFYANPYADVDLEVRLTAPDLTTSTVHGFWDGGGTWRVRFAFPRAGTWHYETICSNPFDPGLHGRTGSIDVEPNASPVTLRAYGFPRVAPSGRYLIYADGRPFFYLADTAWEPWVHLSTADWSAYVANRAAKGFSVIQTASGVAEWWDYWQDGGCPGSATSGLPPWLGPPGAAELINPAYFRVLDAFIEQANEAGIVVATFGLMHAGDHGIIKAEARQRFARTLAARWQGNAVILSPSFDDPWTLADMSRDVGQHLRDVSDQHVPDLLSYHLGTYAYSCDNAAAPGVYNCNLHSEGWVDLEGYQSGHNRPQTTEMLRWSVQRAYEMPLFFRSLTPPKPAINVEPLYEMPVSWLPPGHDLDDNEYRCRQIGWCTYLSGGAGHAYGVRGIWDWGHFLEPQCGEAAVDWRVAMNNPYSRQAELTGRFFRALSWHELEPRHDLVRNQSADPKRHKLAARSAGGTFLVAYLPRFESLIELDLRSMADDGSSRWYDPRLGTYAPGPGFSALNPSADFFSPNAGQDWALLLLADGTGPGSVSPEPDSGEAGAENSGAHPPLPKLHVAAPNPFRDRTLVGFDLSVEDRHARLRIYDVGGHLVRTLADGAMLPSHGSLTWDGRNDRGERVRPGVYAVRLELAGGRVLAEKVTLLP